MPETKTFRPRRKTSLTLKRMLLSSIGILFAITVGTFAGCAQDVPDIDRTQPRAVEKTIFRAKNEDGTLRTWYFQQTVIDVPFGTGLSFIGEQTETEKIFWDIQEGFLYAYRAYEYVKNAEIPHKRNPDGTYKGAPVAAFRIESHFDIQRSYNAATGEQTNVIVENTSDRPWLKRKYMRVDFSKNLIADFNFATALITQNAVGYYIPETETTNKDRAKITDDYIDVVHKLYATPEIDPDILYYYGQAYPICWLYSSLTHDCRGQTIKIRSSFMPVKKQSYTPIQYTQAQMDKFGYFRTTRYSYDRGYGVTEQATNFYVNRWSIWRNESTCKSAGSKPYATCEIQQIPVHLNEQFPADLKAAAGNVMAQWNTTFRELVKQLSGKDQGPVFILCPNNPVGNSDPSICGKPGDNPQIGDIRYSFMYWVNEPGRASPLGYGPSAIDPQTGQILTASAYMYGAELDLYATYATDLVRVLNGDLKDTDVTNSNHIRTYFQNLQKNQQRNRHQWHGHGHIKFKTNKHWLKKKDIFRKKLKRGIGTRDYVAARLQRISKASGLEDILRGNVFKAFGLHALSPTGQINNKIRQHFSLGMIANRNTYRFSRMRLKKLAKRNIMMADFIDDSIIARALQLKKQFADSGGKVDYVKIKKSIREAVFISTALHEVGHILGLRHNFAGSSDALNYHDKYWDLKATTVPTGSTTPVPEYRYNKQTISVLDNAIRQGMREYQYSSIMDYGGSFASDIQGLGKYDRAAIMYGYGNLVEVFKTTVLTPNDAGNKLYPEEHHYTQLPVLVSGPGKPYTQQVKSLQQGNRQWVPETELKTKTNLVEVPYRFCSDEYHAGTANCYAFDIGADYYERVQGFANKYWSYYIFDAFKRSRVTFGDVGSYIGTIYYRYFSPMSDQYKHFLNDWWYSGSGFSCGGDDWSYDPKCGENGIVAAVTALNFFARVIQIPDVGCYQRTSNNPSAALTMATTSACQSGTRNGTEFANIPLGVGRYMIGQFSYAKYGYEYAWKPTSIGTWWDKYMAVMALGDPYTSFLGVDTESNFNNYMINFNTMFGRYVNNLVGAFILSRNDWYGPVVQNGTFTYRDPVKVTGDDNLFDGNPTYSGSKLNPNEQYSAQYMAGLLATIYFAADLNDQYFNESIKISVKGRDDSPEVPADVKSDPNQYIELVDPGSKRMYYAVKVNNLEGSFQQEPNYFSVGYEYLKKLKADYFNADGKTLKSTVQRWQVEAEFHFINVMIGWVRAGEYNIDSP